MFSLIDFLFPKKCINCQKFGDFICADCFAKISYNQSFVCPVCLRPSVDGMTHPVCVSTSSLDGAVSAVVYNGVTRKMIRQFKYKPHVSRLSELISEIMNEGLAENESFYHFIEQFEPVIMPIPLSSKRLRERGYNHAELLTSYVAQYFKLKMDPGILVRIKDTKPQFKLNKEERRKNIEGAFSVRKNPKNPNTPKAVVVVDDVATTFATLKEAARVLKRNGAKKVLGVTFAREV